MWMLLIILGLSAVCFAVFFATLAMSGRNDRRDERRP